MKLNELKEALARDDMIADRAKTDFIEKVVTELGKIADKSAISNPVTQQATSTPAQPSSTQQATPPNNVAQQAAQTRQQKLAIAANTAQAGMTAKPNPAAAEQTPAQVRQQKLAIAANSAQAGMTPVRKPVVWKSGRNPTAPAVARENTTFDILNKIFESILYVDEDTSQSGQPPSNGTISDLVSYYFVKLMNSNIFSNDESKNKISQFAKEVEQSYPTDKGRAALQQMGEWAWETFENSKQRKTNPAVGQQTNPAADQQSTVGVRQINKIIPTLRKRDLLSVKKTVDNTLAGKSSIKPSVAASTTNTGSSAFGQMVGQLSGGNKSTSSTGGTTTKTPTGLVHTAKPQNQSAAQAAPATDNIITMPKGKAGQVRASREGGVTPEEQAKFDQRVQAAMASQK